MLTRCPKCKTLFRTSDADLRRAGGKTRCSQCYTVFLATEASVDDGELTQHGTPVMRSQAASALMQKLINKNTTLDETPQARPMPSPGPGPSVSQSPTPHDNMAPNNAGMSSTASSIYNELVIKNREVKYDIPDSLDDQDLNVPPLSPPSVEAFDANHFNQMGAVNSGEESQRIYELTQKADRAGLREKYEQLIRANTSHPNLSRAPSRGNAGGGHEYSFIPDILQDDLYEDVHIPSAKRNAMVVVLVLVLLLASTFQYIHFMRFELANNNRVRPYVIRFCKWFQCQVPYKKDTNQFRWGPWTHEVDKDRNDVRVVNAKFFNTADFTQPFPYIEVKIMSSQTNTPIALVRLPPKEYLVSKSVDLSKGLPPKSAVDIHFKYVVPNSLINQTPSIELNFK